MTDTPIPCEQCAHVASYKVREQLQQPYRGLWQGFIARLNALPFDMPEADRLNRETLERWAIELWAEQPDASQMFALATTRYGREGENGA